MESSKKSVEKYNKLQESTRRPGRLARYEGLMSFVSLGIVGHSCWEDFVTWVVANVLDIQAPKLLDLRG